MKFKMDLKGLKKATKDQIKTLKKLQKKMTRQALKAVVKTDKKFLKKTQRVPLTKGPEGKTTYKDRTRTKVHSTYAMHYASKQGLNSRNWVTGSLSPEVQRGVAIKDRRQYYHKYGSKSPMKHRPGIFIQRVNTKKGLRNILLERTKNRKNGKDKIRGYQASSIFTRLNKEPIKSARQRKFDEIFKRWIDVELSKML